MPCPYAHTLCPPRHPFSKELELLGVARGSPRELRDSKGSESALRGSGSDTYSCDSLGKSLRPLSFESSSVKWGRVPS